MTDVHRPNRAESSWSKKLALTVGIGGALTLGTYAMFSSRFDVPNSPFGPVGLRHVATAFFWSLTVATLLSLSGKTSWQTMVVKALSLAIAASLVIMAVIVVFLRVGERFADHIIH